MSQISTVHAAVLVRLSTLLTSHTRLVNPYRIESNIEPYLKQGYGLALSGGFNSKLTIGCQIAINRDLIITISRKFYGTDMSASARSTTELLLLEDQLLLIKDFQMDGSLNTVTTNIEYKSDSGILFVKSEEDNFLYLETIFALDYFESLT